MRTVFCGMFYRRGAARGSAGGVSPPVRKWRDGYVAFAGGMPGGGGARANGEPASFSDRWEGGPVGRPRAGIGRRAEGGLSAFDEGLLSRGVSFPGAVYGIGRQPISITDGDLRFRPTRGLHPLAACGSRLRVGPAPPATGMSVFAFARQGVFLFLEELLDDRPTDHRKKQIRPTTTGRTPGPVHGAGGALSRAGTPRSTPR